MVLSENVGYIPNEIAIFHRDFMISKTIGFRDTQHFQTHPNPIAIHIIPYNPHMVLLMFVVVPTRDSTA